MIAGIFLEFFVTEMRGDISKPFSVAKDDNGHEGYEEHDAYMYPKCVGIVAEWDIGAHGENIRVDGHGKHDGRENRQNFHGEVKLV